MAQSRVVVIHGRGVHISNGQIDETKIIHMFQRGFQHLKNGISPSDCIRSLFHSDEHIGLKVNTLGGPKISTNPTISLLLAHWLTKGGLKPGNLLIWDRSNAELRQAGYRLTDNPGDIQIFGTDKPGAGYENALTVNQSIGSRFSRIQSRSISASISLAILKDHGLAGITAGMKNYFGAIHNPNKYHDFNCNPFIADLFETPPILQKHKLTILDGLNIQFHRGPSFHAKWNQKEEIFIFSTDPVAADATGWRLIEKLRASAGLPTLKEEKREPAYLFTAERKGLGRANLKYIEVIEDEI